MSVPDNTVLLEEYFKIGRTLNEISNDFGTLVDGEQDIIEKILGNRQDDFNIFPTVNDRAERIYHVKRKPFIFSPQSRVWSYFVASDETGTSHPYIIIRMPDETQWKKMKVYILGDLHYGAKSFDREAFDAFIQLISNKEHAFLIGIGDLIENALGDSVGGSVYEQTKSPRDQICGVRELIRPVAHKILCATPGNHEWRTFIATGIDLLEFGVCDPLGIPYFSEPVHIDILWRGHIFTFFIQHGKGNAQTKGGKLNNAARPLGANEFTMFTVMGHVHDPMTEKHIKRCRRYIRDQSGKIINMQIVERIEYVVICTAFYKSWTNYGARAGYSPVSHEIVHACVLDPDGRYRVESKPLIIHGR